MLIGGRIMKLCPLFPIRLVAAILLLSGFRIDAAEPTILPRRNASPTTSTLALLKQGSESGISPLVETPRLLLTFYAFRVNLQDKYRFGIEWDKSKLEQMLGQPLRGQFQPTLKNPAQIEVESLVLSDPEKMMNYLSLFGETKLLYKQVWSQSLGQQITREYNSVTPYITTFNEPNVSQKKQPIPYTQSSIKAGMSINVTVEGLQISGEEPSADMTFEINLKDSYKTKEDLPAVNSIISADSTTIPLDHTLIQTNLFHKEEANIEYIFLLCPRKVE